jgi:hypothetical protein
MRFLLQVVLCVALAGSAMAQRGGYGGGGRAGGFGGMGGRGVAGGGVAGGTRGAYGGGIGAMGGRGYAGGGYGYVGGGRGYYGGGRGYYGGGFRGGYGYRGGTYFNVGFWPYGYYPAYGFGWGYGFGYPYSYYSPYAYYGYDGSYPYASTGYASYPSSPNVVVVYPDTATSAASVTRQYDQYGQQIRPSGGATASGPPVYLLAFNDHSIRAATAYWVDGQMLHYVTLEREERQAPLSTVDRAFTQQLNRERQVPFQLPAQ